MPRSAIIWTRSRELNLNVRYHRTHRMMISRSKCRPLKSSCAEGRSASDSTEHSFDQLQILYQSAFNRIPKGCTSLSSTHRRWLKRPAPPGSTFRVLSPDEHKHRKPQWHGLIRAATALSCPVRALANALQAPRAIGAATDSRSSVQHRKSAWASIFEEVRMSNSTAHQPSSRQDLQSLAGLTERFS